MRKRIIIFAVLIIGAIVTYNYLYQDHRDIENETAAFELSATSMASMFSEDITKAESQYLNTTTIVVGKVSEITQYTITLDDKIFCQFSEATPSDIQLHSELKIKGRVIGYDDLLEQIKLDQCSFNN